MDKWLSRLESSQWLSYVKETLNCACLVSQCIDQETAAVLLHGGEGLDSTLAVSALAQVILSPDSRTVHGYTLTDLNETYDLLFFIGIQI